MSEFRYELVDHHSRVRVGYHWALCEAQSHANRLKAIQGRLCDLNVFEHGPDDESDRGKLHLQVCYKHVHAGICQCLACKRS